MFQYSWNANELYLFKANIAYALRQYYSQKNQTLLFTSVSTAKLKIWSYYMLCFPLMICRYHICLRVIFRSAPADQRTSSRITRLPESPSTLWSPTQQVPPCIFQRLIWRLPYGEALPSFWLHTEYSQSMDMDIHSAQMMNPVLSFNPYLTPWLFL